MSEKARLRYRIEALEHERDSLDRIRLELMKQHYGLQARVRDLESQLEIARTNAKHERRLGAESVAMEAHSIQQKLEARIFELTAKLAGQGT